MEWLAAAGWLVALLTAVAWCVTARRHRCVPPRPPSSIQERTHVQVLQDAKGHVESVRTVRGAPPHVVWRPHGKSTATRYPFLGQSGDRYIFRADV